MKVTQISFDVKVPAWISSENLVKNVEGYLKDLFVESLGTNAVDVTEHYPDCTSKPLTMVEGVVLNGDHTIEWCPHCEEEVKLPQKIGQYPCPNCGEMIINCSMCLGCKPICLALEEKVTLTAYPAYDPNTNDGDDYTYYCREFTIPVSYARKLVVESQDWDGMTYEEFLNEYTWDHTDGWVEMAHKDGKLIQLIEVPLKGDE